MRAPATMALSLPGGEPENLLCPVTRVMFKDPVFNEAGNTYERTAVLELWKRREDYFDPLFNRVLKNGGLWPNWDKRREVQDFLSEHRTYVPEGWEGREVPSVPTEAEERGREGFLSGNWPLLMAMCPKRRSVRVIVMAIGSLAVAVGSLIVEFTCLSEGMGRVWPCSQLDAVLQRYSAWYVAPFCIALGGVIVGGCLGIVAGFGLMGYICAVWLLHLVPSLVSSTIAHLRGRQAVAHAYADSQRNAQARLLAQAEVEAQARVRAQERAVALEEAFQLLTQTPQSSYEEAHKEGHKTGE